MEHKLKTWVRYWDAVAAGDKTFEVRKNDRGFQTGDTLVLECWDPEKHHFVFDYVKTPPVVKVIRKRVTFLLQGGQFGIEPCYCVLGLGDVQ